MRALLAVVVVLMALWSGWWFAGRGAVLATADAVLAAARDEGLEVQVADLSLAGFPNRFDLTATGVDARDPIRGWGWQAPFAQVFSLSYKPWHVIAAFPDSQTLTTPAGPVTVETSRFMASLRLLPNTDLPLEQAVAEVADLSLTGTGLGTGQGASLAALTLGLRSDPSRAASYELGVDASGIALPPALSAMFPPDLAAQAGALRLTAFLQMSAPLDRHAGEAGPRLTGLDLRLARLDWGGIVAEATGSLASDARGLAEGRIELTLDNWRALLPVIGAAGVLRPEMLPTVTRMLEVLETSGGTPGRVAMPLVFRDGQASLGPFPLGPAPALN